MLDTTRRKLLAAAGAITALSGCAETEPTDDRTTNDAEPTNTMPTVRIHHQDGSTDEIPATVEWSYQRTIGEMKKLVATVDRESADGVDLERKQDEIELVGVDRGRLVNIERSGSALSLIGYSFEWDAKRTEPTQGGYVAAGTDADIATEVIDLVDSWNAGTIEEHTQPLEFIFNHAFPHEALRRLEKNVPGEFVFDEHEVSYVKNRGEDRTGEITISPGARNLDGDINVKERSRTLDGTHFRILGAHEGEAQIFATLVPSDDPAEYENRVDYETDRWPPEGYDAGDVDVPREWDRWENMDVSSQGAVEAEAESLAEEATEELVEVSATIVGEDLSVGDWIHVEKDEEGINRDMRVHKITTTGSGSTVVDECTLSTRTVFRDDDHSNARDTQRFNTAFQGNSVWSTIGPVEQNVDVGEPLELPFYYPEIEYENKVELYIDSRQFRHYSQPESHDHEVTFDIDGHVHDFTLYAVPHIHVLNDPGQNSAYSETSGVASGSAGDDDHTHTFGVESELHDFEEVSETSEGGGGFVETETTDETTGVSIGVETTIETAENVDVVVNGTTVAENIGSGFFTETVDLRGVLNRDTDNEIWLETDNPGRFIAVLNVDGYRKIGRSDE